MTSTVRAKTRDGLAAAAVLAFILLVAFAPVVSGQRHLMLSGWDTASIMNSGVYDPLPRPAGTRVPRTSDPGAPAWQTEAWFALLGEQFWREFNLPLWNPYSAYGTPLAASGQPQPFFPLATLLSLHLTTWTYSLFIIARLFLGGLLTFLFARQFLTALPSLVAATTFMLSGYFIVYLNMPHLSVEVLTPGVFLMFELLLRRKTWGAAAAAAAMILLGNVAGMPESLFLIVLFGSLYFVCRLLFTAELRAQALPLLSKFVVAVILGFALSAFLLLPFVEFVRLAFDFHQPSNVGGLKAGLGHDVDYFTTIMYLLPLIFGPVLASIFANFAGWSGLRGYWGIVPFFFAVVAVLSLLWRRKAVKPTSEQFLIAFFAITLVLMLLKRYGNPVINWIGALPLSEMVVYPKYQEPLIALCVAMLAGCGFAVLVEHRAPSRLFGLAGILVLAFMLGTAGWYLPDVLALPQKLGKAFYFLSVALGVELIMVTVIFAWVVQRAPLEKRPWLLRAFVGLLSLELLVNFILPCFYLFGGLAPAKADPYAGAPYIGFILGRNTDHSRIFARENFLYPNWSSAFGLADVRSLDALHYYRYRLFIRNFLLPPGDTRIHGDLADRFTGGEFPFEFATDTEKRYLALSSVKYLISDSDYGSPTKVTDEILNQHKGEVIRGFGPATFQIGDRTKSTVRGLFQHPPSPRITYKTRIDAQEPIFEATILIKSEAHEKSDGVGFRLEVKEGDRIETVFQTVLNPKEVPADRSSRAVRVDLGQYAGREVELLFSTDPGPSGDNARDWAGWAAPRFAPRDGAAPPPSAFQKIYDGEVRVYEVPNVMPRAAIFRAAEILPDDDVLARLKDPAFNPNEKAIMSRESLPADASVLRPLAEASGAPISAAQISRYQSQYVSIEAETEAPALLVLNDANYPGWRAYVNGQPAPMVTANYLFRGVFLPAGKSTVEFRYQPRSFQVGIAISLAAFIALAGLMFHERRRRRAMALRKTALKADQRMRRSRRRCTWTGRARWVRCFADFKP